MLANQIHVKSLRMLYKKRVDMSTAFWVKTNTLRIIQRLVGMVDARFICNPIVMDKHARVSLSFDRVPDNYHKFMVLVKIT